MPQDMKDGPSRSDRGLAVLVPVDPEPEGGPPERDQEKKQETEDELTHVGDSLPGILRAHALVV
jgi:hypothetical protein